MVLYSFDKNWTLCGKHSNVYCYERTKKLFHSKKNFLIFFTIENTFAIKNSKNVVKNKNFFTKLDYDPINNVNEHFLDKIFDSKVFIILDIIMIQKILDYEVIPLDCVILSIVLTMLVFVFPLQIKKSNMEISNWKKWVLMKMINM